MDYMVSDAANGSSIRSCLMAARENARAVRGTLTTEVWETQNQTWLEFQRMVATDAFQRARARPSSGSSSARICRAASPSARCCRTRPSTSCASAASSSAPTTPARLVDVKFHAVDSEFFGFGSATGLRRDRLAILQAQGAIAGRRGAEARPAGDGNGKDVEFDFYHWSAVLRSVSGFEVYRKVYRNVIRRSASPSC
jgi:uncharacterized alpha-E superfamily protein